MTDKIIPMPGTQEPEAPTALTAETAPKKNPSFGVFCIADELIQPIDLLTALKDLHIELTELMDQPSDSKDRDLAGGMSTAMLVLLDHVREELQRFSDELFELSSQIKETETACRKE